MPFPWRQGEHLSITGNTGSGKTTLANALLYARRYTLTLKSKFDDAPLPGKVVKSTREFLSTDEDRFVVYPEYTRQYAVFNNVLEKAWQGKAGWAIYFDELPNITDLKLTWHVDRMLKQGRSKGITVISGMQRPVGVTRFAMSQATHVISFGLEGRDVKTMAEITNDRFAKTLTMLPRYHFGWYYVPERTIWTGRVQSLVGGAPCRCSYCAGALPSAPA